MPRIVLLALVALLMTACGGETSGSPTAEFGVNQAITWDRNPDTIVFRAEITGGNREQDFQSRNDIAPCTVYGDNRVVWVNDLGDFRTEVLFDQVSDDAIRQFVDFVTIIDRIYSYPERASVQLPSATAPVYEQLSINVAGQAFVSDAFAGWPADYFQTILGRCKNISQTPVLFEPTAGWVSAAEVAFSFEFPSYPWEASAAGLSFSELAASGERRWISDNNVRILWNLVRTSPAGFRLMEGDRMLQIALEVPRVTRYSPAAQG
jgi:hypothetical protein